MAPNVKPDLLKPRWRKVFSDLWEDKTRTGLVVASVAVGVFAMGMIVSAFSILGNDINEGYAAINPVNIEIWTDPFHDNLVRVIEDVPGVEEAEGRYVVGIRARKDGQPWNSVSLIGKDDFTGRINRLDTIDGTQVPGRNQVVVSKDARNDTGFQVGDDIEIELPDGSSHHLLVVGLVTDQSTARVDAQSGANAIITMETMRSFGLGKYKNRLLITVDGVGDDKELIAGVAKAVEDRVKENHLEVYRLEQRLSTQHPMSDMLMAIVGLLGALGMLITVLSGSLIVNTLNALMMQQMRQIGVMKLVGGRSNQILGMYLTLIVAYGVIALAIAVPLGAVAGYGLASFIAVELGAVVQGFRFIPAAVTVQVLIAIIVPLAAGFIPVNRGARTKVLQAISNYRPSSLAGRQGFLARRAGVVRWISRPILLSFRNTFRKTGRLLLTIFTLTIAGAIFIAVFNVRASMNDVMAQILQHFMGDVTLNFTQPYKVDQVENILTANIPGVAGVEGWQGTSGEIWDGNDSAVTSLMIVAPPQNTKLLNPEFVAGRWLLPGEKNAMVVSDSIYQFYPDLQPGDRLNVKISGNRKEEWTVVGIYRFVKMLGSPMAYVTFDFLAEKMNLPGQAFSFRIITQNHDAASQQVLMQHIDTFLSERHYAVESVKTGSSLQDSATMAVNTLIGFLLIMALLTAFVGSIGLTGTMSINVLERTREIGVMRTIGAVDSVIMQSVIIEALVIGWMTWFLAIGVSLPITSALLAIVGNTMMGSALNMSFTPLGVFLWLLIVVALSIVASIVPARNAARLTINEVLAYE